MGVGASCASWAILFAAAASGAPLERAADVRALSARAAAESPEVRLTGTVTFRAFASFGAYAFVQDDSAGVFVWLPESPPAIEPGDRLTLTGRVEPGDFAPVVRATRVTRGPPTPFPTPRTPNLARAGDGHLDGQWGRVRGVARLTEDDAHAELRTLYLAAENLRIRVDFPPDVDRSRLDTLWGSEVEIEGVLATLFNERGQALGLRLMAPDLHVVRVLRPRVRAPFDRPRSAIRDLRRFRAQDGDGVAHVHGVVVDRGPDGAFTLQDGGGGIRAYATEAPPLHAALDVACFVDSSPLTPVLRGCRVREAVEPRPPRPVPVEVERLLEIDNADRLLSTRVEVLDHFIADGTLYLSTRHADGLLQVAVPHGPEDPLPDFEPGATLRITGVLSLLSDGPGAFRKSDSFAWSATAARLRVRALADIEVVRGAPLWTSRRTLGVMGGLVLCICLGVAWVVALRRRVHAQTRIIREQLDRQQALKEAAESANEAKSTFLANVSHELRTPMNGVLGVADLLCHETTLAPEHQELVRTIRRSGDQLLTLLDDLLDLSKIEAGALELEPTPSSVASVVHGSAGLVSARIAEAGLALDVDIAEACPEWVHVDRTRLGQVLLNLLSNAIKFTETGRITVRVRPGGPNGLRFEVEDTGIGLAEPDLEKLFQRFRQAGPSRKYGGTGLGLAICKALVEAMGGRIGVESRLGVGSTFWFTVEAPPMAGRIPSEPEGHEVPTPSGDRRALLVDDHPINLKVAERMLGRLGIQPDLAESGEDALVALRAHEYDLVFMDVHMPGMDGMACTRVIREERGERGPPYIVALTADAGPEARRACLEAGMNDHLAKPLSVEALARVLARARAQAASGPAARARAR